MEKIVDLAIIGGGPAGLSAGIYGVRKNLSTVVLEKAAACSTVRDAVFVENYLGVKKLTGMELADRMVAHAREIGVEIKEYAGVKEVIRREDGFGLSVDSGEQLHVRALVLATGTSHRELKVKGAEEFKGKGISYCATCDGPLFKDRPVVVVGGGNSGVTNALYLAEICSKVYVIEYGHRLRADEIYLEELKKAGVDILTNTELFEIFGKDFVEGVKVRNRASNEEQTIACEGVFVYIGLLPNNQLAKQLGCELDERGYVKVDKHMRTSQHGVFAAGDITGNVQQIIVAAGQGAVAALSAYDYLRSR
jgi:thioredoxin reductase (NADPH)